MQNREWQVRGASNLEMILGCGTRMEGSEKKWVQYHSIPEFSLHPQSLMFWMALGPIFVFYPGTGRVMRSCFHFKARCPEVLGSLDLLTVHFSGKWWPYSHVWGTHRALRNSLGVNLSIYLTLWMKNHSWIQKELKFSVSQGRCDKSTFDQTMYYIFLLHPF